MRIRYTLNRHLAMYALGLIVAASTYGQEQPNNQKESDEIMALRNKVETLELRNIELGQKAADFEIQVPDGFIAKSKFVALAQNVQLEKQQARPPSSVSDDLTEPARRMSQLDEEIGRAAENYKAQKKKFIGTRANEYRFVRYVENWKNKLERVATQNYPEAARGKLYGTAIVTVEIGSDGAVRSVEINRSSGHEILDDAVKQMVMMASPFAPFPPEIRQDTDIIVITRTWTFANYEKKKPEQDEKATQFQGEGATQEPGTNLAQLGYSEQIRQKIRVNLKVPGGTPIDARAAFSVVQLPNGEILSIALKSSSGFPRYDNAAMEAIRLSSPLPKAQSPELFSRELLLTVQP